MKGSIFSDWTLTRLTGDLASGRTSSREQVEACLERATLPGGEGQRTFLKLAAEPARAAADYFDELRLEIRPMIALLDDFEKTSLSQVLKRVGKASGKR